MNDIFEKIIENFTSNDQYLIEIRELIFFEDILNMSKLSFEGKNMIMFIELIIYLSAFKEYSNIKFINFIENIKYENSETPTSLSAPSETEIKYKLFEYVIDILKNKLDDFPSLNVLYYLNEKKLFEVFDIDKDNSYKIAFNYLISNNYDEKIYFPNDFKDYLIECLNDDNLIKFIKYYDNFKNIEFDETEFLPKLLKNNLYKLIDQRNKSYQTIYIMDIINVNNDKMCETVNNISRKYINNLKYLLDKYNI